MSSVSRPDYDSAVSLTTVRTLRIATYNVHRCRGLDGRTPPRRLGDGLRWVEADVVALQEVIGPGPHGGGHLEALGAALGMGWVMSAARQLRGHQFGNAVLSSFPIVHYTDQDLTWKTCEARRLQRVDISIHATTLHVYNVQLGRASFARRYQAQRLATAVT